MTEAERDEVLSNIENLLGALVHEVSSLHQTVELIHQDMPEK